MKITKSNSFANNFKEVVERSAVIPFGNSNWQIDSIVSEAKTPERAYRALLLNFTTKLNDLKTAERKRRRDLLEVELLKEQIAQEDNPLKKKLLELDIEEVESGYEYTNKLALDCVMELNHMWGYIEKMPHYSRADFEQGEVEHFKLRNAQENNYKLLSDIKNKTLKNKTKGEIQ